MEYLASRRVSLFLTTALCYIYWISHQLMEAPGLMPNVTFLHTAAFYTQQSGSLSNDSITWLCSGCIPVPYLGSPGLQSCCRHDVDWLRFSGMLTTMCVLTSARLSLFISKYVKTQATRDWFSLNFILGSFTAICWCITVLVNNVQQ
jgi:hypothetical protein